MKMFATGAVCAFLVGNCLARETAFVRLHETAVLMRSEVVLGDIAEVVAGNPTVAAAIDSTPVARFDAVPNAATLERNQVEGAVNTTAARLGVEVAWGGNDKVTLRRGVQKVSLSAVLDAGAVMIAERWLEGRQGVLQLHDTPETIEVPVGHAIVKPEFSLIRRFGNSIELPLIVSVDGATASRPVARYRIRVDTARQTAAQPSDATSTPQMDAGASRRGEVVAKNSAVRVLVRSGPIQLESEGIVLADAQPGNEVSVRRAGSPTELRGRLTDARTVEILEQ